MGRLKINRVHYNGDKYTYSSPPLTDGVNIIEAGNGGGKSTFSALICYALGDYVHMFNFSKEEVHFEVKNDTNNFVLLEIEFNYEPYLIKRYFGQKQNNMIIVQDKNGEEESFYLNRQHMPDGQSTYSDWLLQKLNIEVVDVWQGTSHFKVNFTDLFRLIHYDQVTEPRKIYKEHKSDNNFISDSTHIRKVIFELLVGHRFSDFYAMLGKLRELEKQRDAKKILFHNFGVLATEMGYDIDSSPSSELLRKLTEDKLELQRVQLIRNEVKNRKSDSSKFEQQIQQLRQDLVFKESELAELQSHLSNVSFEQRDLIDLKEELIREVSHINKIIFSHNTLHLFSPDQCPCCFNKVERVSGHCLCGAEIQDGQIERFFYNSQEYIEILRSKQKSVETIEVAINSCGKEITSIQESIKQTHLYLESVHSQLKEAEQHTNANNQELLQLNERVYRLRNTIQDSENRIKIIEKYEVIERDFNKAKSDYNALQLKVNNTQDAIEKLIQAQVKRFNKIYNGFMTKTLKDVTNAEINDDYMPVLNDGYYKEASSNVPKRFLYFLTLLSMSLDANSRIPFPQFLLIDTPENLGIDKDNLDKCMDRISELESSDYQIILTTGLGKYPKSLSGFIKQTINEGEKLLKLKS
ncbi:AAA family ATPase [Paenibacillus mesotrionivorans]|uniref:AAA family ATPase n=1 Tax=Paenibacillus mesotrionivorans TaxID=3160968 RepID=A0ACC7P4H4_9BACL